MKLLLLNTREGLKPCYDQDFEEKKKLKIGEVYSVTIKLVRNYQFHKKYFALINCAWEFQNEATQKHFKDDPEKFRETVEVAAGNTETFFDLKERKWLERKKSISFENMDNAEFSDLYERVKNVLYEVFLSKVDQYEFERSLINF